MEEIELAPLNEPSHISFFCYFGSTRKWMPFCMFCNRNVVAFLRYRVGHWRCGFMRIPVPVHPLVACLQGYLCAFKSCVFVRRTEKISVH